MMATQNRNVAYTQPTAQPPIFGQPSQPQQPIEQSNSDQLLRLLTLLRGSGKAGAGQQGGIGNLLAGKGMQ